MEVNKIYHGDCLEVMKDIGSGSVDMILCDPPYKIASGGGGMLGKGGREFINEIDSLGMCETKFDIPLFLNSCLSVFQDKDFFCGVFFFSKLQMMDYLTWISLNGFQYGVGVWAKKDPPPLCNNKYLNDIEFWVYIKGKKSRIYGSYHTKSLFYDTQVNRRDKVLYDHPTIKPLGIVERFIGNHTNKGDCILDPCIGSGTTAVAAINTHRNFIGIEKEEKYVEIARQRITQAEPQLF